MGFKCIVVDDEELARGLLTKHLSKLDRYELVASCESAIAASKVLRENPIDLMFLDIEMPVLRGIDFLMGLSHRPKVIMTTAYRDYAVDGFDLGVVDYLLKPISFARFFKSIEKFELLQEIEVYSQNSGEQSKDFIFIRKERKQVKLFLDQINYIEGLKDYIKIHTGTETHVIKHGLNTFYHLLDTRFLRTHRSYVVNCDKITAYTSRDVEIKSIEVPIGEHYKEAVFRRLKG